MTWIWDPSHTGWIVTYVKLTNHGTVDHLTFWGVQKKRPIQKFKEKQYAVLPPKYYNFFLSFSLFVVAVVVIIVVVVIFIVNVDVVKVTISNNNIIEKLTPIYNSCIFLFFLLNLTTRQYTQVFQKLLAMSYKLIKVIHYQVLCQNSSYQPRNI